MNKEEIKLVLNEMVNNQLFSFKVMHAYIENEIGFMERNPQEEASSLEDFLYAHGDALLVLQDYIN